MSGIIAPAPAIMSMWVVTNNTTDFPGQYVARRHEIGRGKTWPTEDHTAAATLDGARAAIPPGLARFERDPADVPEIVEVWL